LKMREIDGTEIELLKKLNDLLNLLCFKKPWNIEKIPE
jgi:hypothetical protein